MAGGRADSWCFSDFPVIPSLALGVSESQLVAPQRCHGAAQTFDERHARLIAEILAGQGSKYLTQGFSETWQSG